MMKQSISISRDRAIALYDSGWWRGMPARKIVNVQLFIEELCMPFDEYHKAVEDALGRPVWTHEFGTKGADRLKAEFLDEKPAPTMQEIIDMIPADKRIVIRP